MFSKFGKITNVDFLFHKSGPQKGKPRGYAFVKYADENVSFSFSYNLVEKLHMLTPGSLFPVPHCQITTAPVLMTMQLWHFCSVLRGIGVAHLGDETLEDLNNPSGSRDLILNKC